jgi:iron complex outermembrane receptor protein
MKKSLLGVSTLALLACAGSALAQNSDASVSEVIVTGTRQVGVKAADSAAPIQIVGGQQLLKTGSTDLASALATSVPSLNIQTNGGDAAAVEIEVALRGLSPNDTLVLVDGKRRHTTSNLAVDGGSIYSGAAAVDLSYIPNASIDHIEVLTDGAAAQYGSDAIAGVVNIILKKTSSGGTINGTGGQFFDSQGATQAFSVNQGFNLNDKGFVNVTLEERTHDLTTLGLGDIRFQNANGSTLSSLSGEAANVVNGPNFPHENRVYGDPQSAIYNFFFNAGYHFNEDVEGYAFGNYSTNTSQHFENYRSPTKISAGSCLAPCTTLADYGAGPTVYAVPNGFDPSEKFDQKDFSITGGLRGSKFGWNWDLSTTYGENSTKAYVINTDNASTFPTLQNSSITPVAYPLHTLFDGSYDATEWSGSLDLDRSFAIGLAKPLNVAFGFEGRQDSYGIGAGEPESYFGSGSQSFAGYSPADAGSYTRTNYAGYIDLATSPITNLTVDVAGRYENYSDFGSTEDGKVTARYDFTPEIAVRGTVSDGFRAPTLAEEHYTGLNVGPTSVSGQFAPNSSGAQAVGFPSLRPEQSINYSAGFVFKPIPKLQITLDAYYILLHDRILPGSGFQALAAYCVPNGTPIAHTSASVVKTCPAGQTPEDVIVSQNILNALGAQGVTTAGLTSVGVSAFINAVNTRTDGIDATATYASDFGEFGHVDWSLGFNYNHTQISSNSNLPSALYALNTTVGINQTKFLSTDSTSALTTAPPREKLILQGFWTKGPWSVNLRETVYNDMKEYVSSPSILESIGTTGITDLDVGYKVTKSIKIDFGANNLFNIIPPLTPLNSTGQPQDGALVYHVPYGFAPWGQNGGYYYGRITLTY